ncbi:Uncharacterised protein [Mycobacteroides abscessus subsp. abscessus]|nr:Uncharacterised protein [Mycobacteroides abscessus subsp. abscessus]
MAVISPPSPPIPAAMSRKSPVMHTAITGSTCSLRMPWRSTNAF